MDERGPGLRATLGPEQVAGVLVGLVLLLAATGYVASASPRGPGASPSPTGGIQSPGSSAGTQTSASPGSSAVSGSTLSSMRGLAGIDDQTFLQAPDLSLATASKRPDVGDIHQSCQTIRTIMTNATRYMTEVGTDESLHVLSGELEASYGAISTSAQACLDTLARDVAANVAAGKALVRAIDGLRDPDKSLRTAITAAGG